MKRRRALAVTVLAGVAAAASVARGPVKATMATGSMPGRPGSWVNSYLNRPSARLMAAALALGPEDDLLDIACGWGELLVVHATQVRSVAGIDVSEEKVTLARQRLAERIAAGTAQVVCGDAATLPWDDATFTAVACMDAFPFFTEPSQVLAEAFRVLRPAGRLVVQIGMRWPAGQPRHALHPSTKAVDIADEAAVRGLVQDAGFAEVSASYGPVGGDSRLGNLASRLAMGSDQLRIVRGVKPN